MTPPRHHLSVPLKFDAACGHGSQPPRRRTTDADLPGQFGPTLAEEPPEM